LLARLEIARFERSFALDGNMSEIACMQADLAGAGCDFQEQLVSSATDIPGCSVSDFCIGV
jgi:hypothetical protein